jgi:hypothetical protein
MRKLIAPVSVFLMLGVSALGGVAKAGRRPILSPPTTA